MKLFAEPETRQKTEEDKKPGLVRNEARRRLTNAASEHPVLFERGRGAQAVLGVGAEAVGGARKAHSLGGRLGSLASGGVGAAGTLVAIAHGPLGVAVAAGLIGIAVVTLVMKAKRIAEKGSEAADTLRTAGKVYRANRDEGRAQARKCIDALKTDGFSENEAKEQLLRHFEGWDKKGWINRGERDRLGLIKGATGAALALELFDLMHDKKSIQESGAILNGIKSELRPSGSIANALDATNNSSTAAGNGATPAATRGASTGGNMSRVDATPEAVRAVAAALDRFVEEVDAAKQKLQQASASSADEWRDPKGEAVRGEIEELLSSVRVDEESSRISNEVNTYASKVEDALG